MAVAVRAVGTVEAVGTAGFAVRRRRDNRPAFPGLAVWVDAVAEIEIDAEFFGLGDDGDYEYEYEYEYEYDEHGERGDSPAAGPTVPTTVDAWSPDYSKVWRPQAGNGPEPRPGLLVSVVRAGVMVAYPTPLPDPPTGALARALARLERPEAGVPERRGVLPVAVESVPAQPPRRSTSAKAHHEVRALVGVLVEVLVGRRAAAHAAGWADPAVRGKLRTPRFARTTLLKSVRISESGDGIEAMALLHDGGRTHAVALRFDRAEDSRWRCTALQTG